MPFQLVSHCLSFIVYDNIRNFIHCLISFHWFSLVFHLQEKLWNILEFSNVLHGISYDWGSSSSQYMFEKKIIRNLKASSNAFVLTSVVCFSLSERYKCNLFENFDRYVGYLMALIMSTNQYYMYHSICQFIRWHVWD